MVPPKARGKKKVRPDWAALFRVHYDAKGAEATVLKIRKVTSCETTEEDSKAGTCTCEIAYEFEPCDPDSTDCTEYGSAHTEYGEAARQVTFTYRDASAVWAVTDVTDPLAAVQAASAAAAAEAVEVPQRSRADESDSSDF